MCVSVCLSVCWMPTLLRTKGVVEGGYIEREVPDEKGCMVSHLPTTAARFD